MFQNLRKLSFTSIVILIITFIVMNLRQLNRPYVIDEAAFPYGAIGILEHGNPIFYNGETRPNDLALWHPPLYIISLALHMVFWGTSPFSVRLFGLICVGITVLIAFFTLNKITSSSIQRDIATVIFAGLYIFNPLVSESALIPDIDGTIALPILAAGLLGSTVLIKSGWNRGLFISCIFIWTLLFFTKFTIALIFLPIFVLASFLSGRNRTRSTIIGLSSVLLGALIFVTAWKFLSIVMKVPFHAPFDYFTNGLRSKSGVENSISHYVQIATNWDPRITMWVGPSLLIISILSIITLSLRSLKARKFDPALIFPIFGVYSFFGYNIIGGVVFTFPKYWIICVLPFAVLCSLELSRWLANLSQLLPLLEKRFPNYQTVSLVSISSAIAIGANYVFSRRNDFQQEFSFSANVIQLLINTTISICLLSILFRVRTVKPLDQIKLIKGMLAIGLIVSISLGHFTMFAIHRNSANSTTYYFNERGLLETINLVRDMAPPGSVIIAPKDVGIQSEIPFYEDAFIAPLSELQVLEYIDANKPSLVVTRLRFDYSESVYPQYFEAIKKRYEPVITNFESDLVIWIPK